jgi:hypothetical protein
MLRVFDTTPTIVANTVSDRWNHAAFDRVSEAPAQAA